MLTLRPLRSTVRAGKGEAIKGGFEEGHETMRPCTIEKTCYY